MTLKLSSFKHTQGIRNGQRRLHNSITTQSVHFQRKRYIFFENFLLIRDLLHPYRQSLYVLRVETDQTFYDYDRKKTNKQIRQNSKALRWLRKLLNLSCHLFFLEEIKRHKINEIKVFTLNNFSKSSKTICFNLIRYRYNIPKRNNL